MQNSERDAASLWDMLQAMQEIQEDTKGLIYEDFEQSRLVRRAVEFTVRIWYDAGAETVLRHNLGEYPTAPFSARYDDCLVFEATDRPRSC